MAQMIIRFDVKMLSSLPDARVVNTRTGGYGTDQEYVAFRNWNHILESGDTVLIVLNQGRLLRCIETELLRSSKALLRESGRLISSSPSAHRPVGTLERLVPRGLGGRKIDRAGGFRELGSRSIDGDNPLHPRSNPR